MGKLIVLMGMSCAGKSTVLDYIKDTHKNINIVKTYTTRPKRSETEDGYYFLSEEEYFDNGSNFISSRVYETKEGYWYYGLSKDNFDLSSENHWITILDEKGYYEAVEKLGEDNVIGIYIWIDEYTRLSRALERTKYGDISSYKELYRRMLDDLDAFDKVQVDSNVYFVSNSAMLSTFNAIDYIINDLSTN